MTVQETSQSATVTASDVAREAGVSRSAVSRTYTPGASVSEKTRKRVEAAAHRLGYKPNRLARSLITRKSNIVGLAVGYMDNQFFPALVTSVCQKLEARGIRALLFPAHGDDNNDLQVEDILSYQIDALLLGSANLSSRLARECEQRGVPVVQINRISKEPGIAAVTGDNENGGYAIGQFAAECGARRPAFIAGLENSSTSQEREASFIRGLNDSGLTLHARACGEYDAKGASAAIRDLMALPEPPDFVFCANDHMAIAAMETARHELGLTIGEDVSIVGFDDVDMAAWPSFSLTTYSQPVDAMAEMAMRQLLSDTPAAKCIRIPGELVIRDSARPKIA